MSSKPLPCVAVINCTPNPVDDFIKGILSCDSLSGGVPQVEDIIGYPWDIDTKYYSSQVYLCPFINKTIGDEDFANRVEATIVLFDASEALCLSSVDSWLPYLTQFNSDVKLLVCDRCSDDDNKPNPVQPSSLISRLKVQQWCISNGFELVELSSSPSNEEEDLFDDVDDGFAELENDFLPETVGIPRIVQALHAHIWSNLQLKEQTESYGRRLQKLLFTKETENEEEQKARDAAEAEEQRKNIDALLSEMSNCDRLLGTDPSLGGSGDGAGGGGGLGDFEQLFSQFGVFKDRASQLSGEDRKAFAENVAVAFWKSIGGEKEEDEEEDGKKETGDK